MCSFCNYSTVLSTTDGIKTTLHFQAIICLKIAKKLAEQEIHLRDRVV